MNITLLRGTLSSDPRSRELPSGSRLVSYEVTARRSDVDRADTVPVVWFEPPDNLPAVAAGDAVLVVGRVVRRFFRGGGGATLSRTEVVADRVVPARQTKRARRLVERAVAEIQDL